MVNCSALHDFIVVESNLVVDLIISFSASHALVSVVFFNHSFFIFINN